MPLYPLYAFSFPPPLLLFFSFLTQWTLMISHYSLYLGYCAAEDVKNFGKGALDKRSDSAIKAQAKTHIFYSFSILLNVLVMSVYWTVIIKEDWKV